MDTTTTPCWQQWQGTWLKQVHECPWLATLVEFLKSAMVPKDTLPSKVPGNFQYLRGCHRKEGVLSCQKDSSPCCSQLFTKDELIPKLGPDQAPRTAHGLHFSSKQSFFSPNDQRPPPPAVWKEPGVGLLFPTLLFVELPGVDAGPPPGLGSYW